MTVSVFVVFLVALVNSDSFYENQKDNKSNAPEQPSDNSVEYVHDLLLGQTKVIPTQQSKTLAPTPTPPLTFRPPTTPTPQSTPQQITISEARNASAFLIKELVDFNGEIDTRTRELNDVIRQNYADFGYATGVYIITKNFELEIGQYTTRWETMKRDNNNALLKLSTITDVDQYLAVAKVTGALLLVSKEQFYRNLGSTKTLIQRYAQDIKVAMDQDLFQFITPEPTPTPSPTFIYIPPTEPVICEQIRNDPDYSQSLKQTKLAYYGCY